MADPYSAIIGEGTLAQPKTIASWPPLAQPEPAWATDSLLLRFVTKVHEATSGCLEWQGAKNRSGYGVINCGDRTRLAHRVAYRLYVGPVPDGMQVCHSCDNPSCVNPDHLWAGTNMDNVKDRDQKGRQPKGMNHGKVKFPTEVIEAVRAERATHGTTYQELSDKNGMSYWTAWSICNNPDHRKHDAPLSK